MSDKYFKVSSGLKSLIGSELITDNFIAVFELVKNSFDARASQVDIRFEDLDSQSPKIIIVDNGKGMDYDDLMNKWLFVAYSAKKEGIEDEVDYRNKIKLRTYYAGAKGVGRFSCDRLGRYLNLISIKDTSNSKIENIKVDWEKFEKNQKDEFIKIPVQYNVLESIPYKINHGTILEISGFDSSEWQRDDLKTLKEKLSKLIRPDLNKTIQDGTFNISLIVPSEKGKDEKEIEKAKLLSKEEQEGYIYRETVNGDIKNFVFEELDIRTTKIEAKISKEGDSITTKLVDRGEFIYEIIEVNPYVLLSNISITLYFLNRSAKAIFTRRMKVNPIEYGNLFVYKNGFRINPYGDRGDDSFGIDNRALQGYARYIGLRNLIGQIDIQEENPELRETTSRAGGFVKTKAYYQLADFSDGLLIKTLRRLEKFVVDVIEWGLDDDVIELINNEEKSENLIKIISNIYDEKTLINIEYNKNLIDILDQREEKSARKLVKNFKRLADETDNPQLRKDANQLDKKLTSALKAKESAEKETKKEREEKVKVKEKLEQQISETLFAKAVVGTETKELLSVQHHIYRHSAQHISALLDTLIDKINSESPKEILLKIADKISFENKKVITLSRFVTKANFDTTTTKIEADLVMFVNEYCQNVYLEYLKLSTSNDNLSIKVFTPRNAKFITKFKPIELIIILDNLLNNSFKAKSSEINLIWEQNNDSSILLHLVDNGVGIPTENLEKIFSFRFSTTNGSGLGLYHVNQIIEGMKGEISVNNNLKKGVEFIIKFKK